MRPSANYDDASHGMLVYLGVVVVVVVVISPIASYRFSILAL